MWWIKDNCGYFCISFTYFLIVCEVSFIYRLGILPLAYEGYIDEVNHLTLLMSLVVMAVWSHFTCMTTCPTSEVSIPGSSKSCEKCKKNQSAQAHHCSVCNICVIRMQHHCPWVNNCIGLYNMKCYVLFLVYTLGICTYCLLMLLIRSIYCITHLEAVSCKVDPKEFLNDLNLGVLLMLFNSTLFSVVLLLLSQHMIYILSNSSYIDTLQSRKPVQRCYYTNLVETFGGKWGVLWILPGIGNIDCLAVEYIE